MSNIIISFKQKSNTCLSAKNSQVTVLTVRGDAIDSNQSLTYRANVKHSIAFQINENVGDNFQVPYPLIF